MRPFPRQTLYKTQVREQKEEMEDYMKQNDELETDLRNLKNERDSITASLQLALTKADSQQLLRKIAEDQVSVYSRHPHPTVHPLQYDLERGSDVTVACITQRPCLCGWLWRQML